MFLVQTWQLYLIGHLQPCEANRTFFTWFSTSSVFCDSGAQSKGWMFVNVFIVVYVQEMDAERSVHVLDVRVKKVPKFCNFRGQKSIGTNGIQAFHSKFWTCTNVYICARSYFYVRERSSPSTPTFGCAPEWQKTDDPWLTGIPCQLMIMSQRENSRSQAASSTVCGYFGWCGFPRWRTSPSSSKNLEDFFSWLSG